VATDDVIVIGGGHNGLACAAWLVRHGVGVTVLEANAELGGCVWTEELDSGHRLERGAIDHSGVVGLAEELELHRFGLRFHHSEELLAAGFADGTRIGIAQDLERTVARVEAVFPGDGDAYRRLAVLAQAVFGFVEQPSPPSFADVVALATAARGSGDLVRLLVASSESVLAERIEAPLLRSALAMAGSHNQLPPWLPGTGIFALLGPSVHGRPAARPVGGSTGLIRALGRAIEAGGGRIVTDARVDRISEAGHGVVVWTSRDRFHARTVVSSLDVVRTTRLLERPSDEFRSACRRARTGALNVAELKVDLALDRPATIGFDGGDPRALWLLQEHERSLGDAFRSILAGRLPDTAAMMWASPSAMDPEAAPSGGGVVWLSSFVPGRLADGSWDESQEERAADRLLEGFRRITGVDLAPSILVRRVTSPRLWRHRIGTDNPNHLDLTLDQLFSWRPPIAARPYRTPLPWLYLSGAGTYPGGGLSGIPGRNAARAVLEDLRGHRRSPWSTARSELRGLRRAMAAYLAMRRST
jgi:phytoene dehydrogenase-like protein